LVCKTNEKSSSYINRDKNAVLNMVSIVNSYIKTNYKPKTFVLGTKICNITQSVSVMKAEKLEKAVYNQ
jgi:hypothetical protein